MFSALILFVEWFWWYAIIFHAITYEVEASDLSMTYEQAATIFNYGISILVGLIVAGLSQESSKAARFVFGFLIGFAVIAICEVIGGGPDSQLTILRGFSATAIALSWGTYLFLKSFQKDEAEQQRVALQLNHKETRRLMEWGLFDRAVEVDAVFDNGLLNLDARYECPKCHTWTTWRDVYSGIRGVEKALKPKRADWLVHCQNLTPYDRDGEPLHWGADPARVEFYPSELQDLLDCSGSEAKRYIAAATKLGLTGQGDDGWPRCSDCVQAKARTRHTMRPSLRRDVLLRDGHRCVSCGDGAIDGARLEVDHILPVAAGGRDELDNLQVLCQSCNSGKSDDDRFGV